MQLKSKSSLCREKLSGGSNNVSFCLLNDFDCKVTQEQSADFHQQTCAHHVQEDLSSCTTLSKQVWKCYQEPIRRGRVSFDPEVWPEKVNSSEFFFSVNTHDSYPRPLINLTTHQGKLVPNVTKYSHSSYTYRFKLEVTETEMDVQLMVHQPGFVEKLEKLYRISMTRDTDEEDGHSNKAGLVLGILLPICFIIGAMISVYFCHKKRLLCFGRQVHNESADTGTSPQLHQGNTAAQQMQGASNSGFVDDSNFTDIDLTDHRANYDRPLSGYISGTIQARYQSPNEIKLTPFELENSSIEEFDETQGAEFNNGRCRSLESFDTNKFSETPGLLNVVKGEELVLIQKDLGSGWTCVQGMNGTGFVPTSLLYFFD